MNRSGWPLFVRWALRGAVVAAIFVAAQWTTFLILFWSFGFYGQQGKMDFFTTTAGLAAAFVAWRRTSGLTAPPLPSRRSLCSQ